MTEEEPLEFGGEPPEDEEVSPSNVIPFPRMRPSTKLREAWTSAVARFNEREGKRYQMPSPLDVVPSLVAKRSMPAMHWPAPWVELARRCRTYVGQCIGVTGPIGGGKTSFALQVAVANTGHGHPIVWAPLELDFEELDLRAVANQHGAHMGAVRESWPQESINHSLTAIDDLWHFVDQYPEDPDQQFQAIEDCIKICWEVYRVPPVLVVDHLGELVAEDRDEAAALRRWSHKFRLLAMRTNSYGILLNQVSKGNQAATTGKVDFESATDAMAIEKGSMAIASAVATSLVLNVFKADDTPILDSHVLIPKARNTGLEGRVGMRFQKAGGVWSELDYLPATPSQKRAEVEADKRNQKHRVGPPRTIEQAGKDLNAARAGDAAAMRRHKITEAIKRHGAMGIADVDLRRVPGVGRGALFRQSLQELVLASVVERMTNQRWRALTRTE